MKASALLTLTLVSVLAGGCAAPTETSEFREPLLVDGVRISDLAIKRALCYGHGRHALATVRINAIVDSEWESRVRARRRELLREEFDGRHLDDLAVAERVRLDDEVERSLARFRYDEAELASIVVEAGRTFQRHYPGLDRTSEVRRRYGSMGIYLEFLRATLAFDQMFFPDNPDGWPEITIEALHTAVPSFDIVADCAKYYELRREYWLRERREAEDTQLASQYGGETRDQLTADEVTALDAAIDEIAGEFMRRYDEMGMSQMRDDVTDALIDLNFVTIQTSANGLAEEALLMTIERDSFRRGVSTEDLYSRIAIEVEPHEIVRTKRFLALMAAARGALERSGQLIPEAEFAGFLQGFIDERRDSHFDLEYVAIYKNGLPSVDDFATYLRLLESYRRSMASILSPLADGALSPKLLALLHTVGAWRSTEVHAEVLLVAAYDEEAACWKPDGWGDARRRAQHLRQQVEEQLGPEVSLGSEAGPYSVDPSTFDEFWSELLDRESGFWDPPMRRGPARTVDRQHKGRFWKHSDLAEYRQLLEESPYEALLNPRPLIECTLDLKPGQVGGPYLGPKGYYFIYLKGFGQSKHRLDPSDEWARKLLEDEYVRSEFAQFCHASLEQAEVSGL